MLDTYRDFTESYYPVTGDDEFEWSDLLLMEPSFASASRVYYILRSMLDAFIVMHENGYSCMEAGLELKVTSNI